MSREFPTDSGAPLRAAFESPEAKRRYVRRLFATIAGRYDFITRVLSFGRDQHWKRRLLALVDLRRGERCLDLATGTGDLAFGAAARGAVVHGLDLTLRMLQLAREKQLRARIPDVSWMAADMTSLPVASESIDVVTTGYGLRNVPDLPVALAEIQRVLKPGGRLAVLDFDRPEQPLVRAVYLGYLDVIGGALGWLLHREPDAYRYIPASIRRYPGARGVCVLMERLGFESVRHIAVLGGLLAIHIARKRAATA